MEFDPTKDTVEDIEAYLKLPLEDKTPKGIGDCKHKKVYLDKQNHTVECQKCKKILDPFWYLQLLAKEWRHRRYCDAEAIQAYRALEQQRLNALARGKHFVKPEEGEGQKCWDCYEALHGHPPEYVYFRGGWYAGKGGGSELFDYIKMQLASKGRAGGKG